MKTSDSTFELVQSLNKNEKRFFQLRSGEKNANYMRLFKVMSQMNDFDAKKLKKIFGGQKINLSYEKNYLQKQVLRSLRGYYSDNCSSLELQDILKNLEILYRKRLTSHCQKQIEKGITLGRKYEQWHYHLELIEWQYRLFSRTNNYKELMEFRDKGGAEKKEIAEAIKDHTDAQDCVYTVLGLVQTQGSLLGEKERARFREIIHRCNELLERHKSSFRIPHLVTVALYLAHNYLGDMKASYRWSIEHYKVFERHPQYSLDSPYKYYTALGNIITRSTNLELYDEARKYIAILKAWLKSLSAFHALDIHTEFTVMIFQWESKILLKTGKIAEALQCAKEFEANEKTQRTGRAFYSQTTLAEIYFANRRFRESLKYANMVANAPARSVKMDYYLFAHLLRICIQFEAEHSDTVTSLIHSLVRFMKKENLQEPFASVFLQEISRQNASGKKDKKTPGSKNLQEMEKYIRPDEEHYELLMKWLKEK